MRGICILAAMLAVTDATAEYKVGDYAKYVDIYTSPPLVQTRQLEVMSLSQEKGFLIRTTLTPKSIFESASLVQEDWLVEPLLEPKKFVETCANSLSDVTTKAGIFKGCKIQDGSYELFVSTAAPFEGVVMERTKARTSELREFRHSRP